MTQKGISSIIIILIIVGVLVVATWIYWREHPSFFCLKEGESGFGPRTWLGKECCYGLKSGYVFRTINDKCTPVTDVGVCINCPNDQCGPGEDNCNCPQDCPLDETANWKTYSWVQECGNFEIKYPNNWKAGEITSDRLGCSGNLSYIPDGYSSFSQSVDTGAYQAVALNLSYSDISAVAETTFEKLKEKIKESPEKSFFPGILQCMKENYGTFFSIECGTTKDGGIYFISGDVIQFEDQINQMLSTFKFTK